MLINAHLSEIPEHSAISRLIEKEIIFYASATLAAIQLLKASHSCKATEQIIVIVTIVGSNLRVELIHP